MKAVYKNALVSVSNKEGLLECVRPLFESGARIVSTGGTAQFLKSAGIQVVSVSDQTQFPEVMGGRVKTLHPHIFLPLLARADCTEDERELLSRNLAPFDLLICNLYPLSSFVDSKGDERMEQVDVGGPSMLRAGAKNYKKVAVLCDPKDYGLLKKGEELSIKVRRRLAAKTFSHLSVYDSIISDHLNSEKCFLDEYSAGGSFVQPLRYGENPQQKAAWYKLPFQSGLHQSRCLQGKELSFNNILDIQSAVSVIREFADRPCFVGIKHTNPCGAACADTLEEAVQKGMKSDPLSIFGGVAAVNKEMNKNTAQMLGSIFLECIIAPSYTQEALSFFSKKKNLRLIVWDQLLQSNKNHLSIYTVDGGFLVQSPDQVKADWSLFKIYGNHPSTAVKKDLEMAWKVCAHLKSNAVSLVCREQTVGLGMGQVDRITAVQLACSRMEKHHSEKKEAVMASDGFFPFTDSIQLAAQKGIRWVIQPGGSVKDPQVLKKAVELGVNVICTEYRHFKH